MKRKTNIFTNIKEDLPARAFIRKNYKKIVSISIVLIMILITSLIYTSSLKYSKHRYHTGEYLGISDGYHSHIEVKVITDDYRILKIDILDHKEMPVISEVVFKDIPYRVIRENSTDIDIVSGATYTSKGLLEALDNALDKARIHDLEENK